MRAPPPDSLSRHKPHLPARSPWHLERAASSRPLAAAFRAPQPGSNRAVCLVQCKFAPERRAHRPPRQVAVLSPPPACTASPLGAALPFLATWPQPPVSSLPIDPRRPTARGEAINQVLP